jgi:PH (Pleckstrin Homology) domain-containing protein
MSHDDFEFEPRRGLPALLPEGERLLWQGSPRWQSLAVRAYQVRKVAVYFGILVLWRVATGLANAHSVAAVSLSCLFIVLLGGIAFGVLCVLAYLNARSTVYSITSRRVLLRHGVAVQLTMNIPLKFVQTAALRPFADGTGDIALTLPHSERIGFLITWPHLRPGRITRPQPSLRALVDAKQAADILSAALAADGAESVIEGTSIRIEPADSAGARTRIPGRATAAA